MVCMRAVLYFGAIGPLRRGDRRGRASESIPHPPHLPASCGWQWKFLLFTWWFLVFMNVRLRGHGPLKFSYGKFCVRSCILIISSDFFGVSGTPASNFLKITAQELPYTWLLKGNLRKSNFVEKINVCIWSFNVNCEDSLESVLLAAFFLWFPGTVFIYSK
ncbi:uncharacterized protein B0J16DRAFT_124616 [Fusarium flagelliforme]|uniref:uncharacterized protein n=1 Tax=Fusarium flagelliforme TaxID=2675880 RepID=UPI001E8CDE3C|nr:uncharacterized protein B0J16DRAFT_124616 [Fusarium flagelliforme]KAH7185109.1 hypothetical protein B0J16DRAFT_124616 [Fusarium flagelliforme]